MACTSSTFRGEMDTGAGEKVRARQGECTVHHLQERGEKGTVTFWYPDQVSFRFRQTVSYWIAVMYLEGALFFTASGFFGTGWGWSCGLHSDVILVHRPTMLGAVCFSVGTYLGFFELINLGIKEGEQVRYFFFRWDDLHTTFEVEWVSLGGVAIYFLGAIFYQVWALCLCLSDELGFALIPDSASTALSLAGGACFAVGGVCEVAYNQILKSCQRHWFGGPVSSTSWAVSFILFQHCHAYHQCPPMHRLVLGLYFMPQPVCCPCGCGEESSLVSHCCRNSTPLLERMVYSLGIVTMMVP